MRGRIIHVDDDWKALLFVILLVLGVLFLGIGFIIWLTQYLL